MNLNEMVIGQVPTEHAVATATNAAATVTLAAPGERNRWLVVGMTISTSAAPATAVALTVSSASTEIERVQFPAALFAPVSTTSVYRGGANEAITVTLPALGAGVVGTVTVRAMKIPATFA